MRVFFFRKGVIVWGIVILAIIVILMIILKLTDGGAETVKQGLTVMNDII